MLAPHSFTGRKDKMSEIEIMPGVDARFTKISNVFCRDKRVTPRAARVFIFLRSHVSGWKITVNSIAKQLGMSKNTVSAALADLEQLRYVKREMLRDDQSRFAATRYQIFEEPQCSDSANREVNFCANDSSGEECSCSTEPLRKNGDWSNEPCRKFCARKNTANGKIEPHKKTNSLRRPEEKKTNPPNPPEGGSASARAHDDARADSSKRKEQPKTRGTFLPDDFQPAASVIEQMRTECPTVDLEAETRSFCDYWRSATGQKARKRDWQATWRNWIRRASNNTPKSFSTRQNASQSVSRGYSPSDWLQSFDQQPQQPTRSVQEIGWRA